MQTYEPSMYSQLLTAIPLLSYFYLLRIIIQASGVSSFSTYAVLSSTPEKEKESNF